MGSSDDVWSAAHHTLALVNIRMLHTKCILAFAKGSALSMLESVAAAVSCCDSKLENNAPSTREAESK
jgi:hypothetical protein